MLVSPYDLQRLYLPMRVDILTGDDYTPHIFFLRLGRTIMDHRGNQITAASFDSPKTGPCTARATAHTRLASRSKLKRSPADPAAS